MRRGPDKLPRPAVKLASGYPERSVAYLWEFPRPSRTFSWMHCYELGRKSQLKASGIFVNVEQKCVVVGGHMHMSRKSIIEAVAMLSA